MARRVKSGLNERQARFCKEYVKDFHGTNAAIRAGYASSCAGVTGSQLLANPKIAAEVDRLSKKIEDKLEITAERIIAEAGKLAFANMEDYVMHDNGDITPHLTDCTRDQMAAVQEFTVDATGGSGDGERKLILRTKFKLADKTRALELLAKMKRFGLMDNKITLGFDNLTDEQLSSKIAELMKRA